LADKYPPCRLYGPGTTCERIVPSWYVKMCRTKRPSASLPNLASEKPFSYRAQRRIPGA
jgi:hypothetical protein